MNNENQKLNNEYTDNSSVLGKIIKKSTTDFVKLREEKKLDDKYIAPPIEEWKTIEGNFKHFSIKKIDLENFPMALITPKSVETNKKIILQLHGGGYEKALINYNHYFSRYYIKVANVEVLTPNYRVAPDDKFPAALEDAVESYMWLLNNGYEAKNIIVAGDSAGGGLALALVMYLINNNIEKPRAIITMSAWTDLTCTLEAYKTKREVDPVFGPLERPLIYRSRYAEGLDKKNPYISPLYGSYNNFPDMLMQVGNHEMLYQDTIKVAEKAKKAGVNVTLSVYDGMFHVFQAYKGILREANEAWKEVGQFIKEKLK